MGKMGFGGFSKPSLFGGRGQDGSDDKRGHDRADDHRGHDRDHDARDQDHGKPQGNAGQGDAGQGGGGHGDAGGSCGTGGGHTGGDHGGGSGGHTGGGHTGGGHGGGDTGGGGGTTPATPFAAIPADTTGVTFHIDLNADGVMDEYNYIKAPTGVDPATQTMQDYYDAVYADLKTDHPNVNPNQIVVKATVYSASQGESYQYFDGTQTSTDAQNPDDGDDDHHGSGQHGSHGGDDEDHGQHGSGHHGSGGGSAGNGHGNGGGSSHDDEDDDGIGSHGGGCQTGASQGHSGGQNAGHDRGDGGHHGFDSGAAFYAKLMGHGDAPSEDDHGSHDEASHEDQPDDLVFC